MSCRQGGINRDCAKPCDHLNIEVMSKRVKLNAVGYLDGEGKDVSDSVYERPVMLVYEGEFDSMDGPVTITPVHIHLLAKNHNALLERVKRLVTGDIPMRDCPPLQLDHSPSASHTIGRLVGALTVGNIDLDGESKLALFGVARFLGRENVEKAKDGRYTHVSIGADLEDGNVNELSVTPFPAAPKASLLSKNSHEPEEKGMHEKLKKHLMEHRKLSEQDAEKLSKDMLSHHMKHMGKSEDEMSKYMAAADDGECKRMAEEHDEHLKKLAAPAPKDEEEKKLARKNDFTKLASGIRSGASSFRLELKKSTVAARLARFRSEAKITPAELKKLDIAKIAALDEVAMEAALSTFDAREPVLRFGSLTGSNKAETVEAITKKYRLARMELESRMNMPSKRTEAVSRLAKLAEEEKKELAEVGNANENDAPPKGMLTKLSYDELVAMLDDKKKHEELKRHLKHMMDHHGIDMPEHGDAHMSALAKKQAELQNSLEQLIALASPALGIKPDEIQ